MMSYLQNHSEDTSDFFILFYYYFVQDGFKVNSINFHCYTNFFTNFTKYVPMLLD